MMAWKGGGAYPCGSGCAAWSRVTANIPADSRGNKNTYIKCLVREKAKDIS